MNKKNKTHRSCEKTKSNLQDSIVFFFSIFWCPKDPNVVVTGFCMFFFYGYSTRLRYSLNPDFWLHIHFLAYSHFAKVLNPAWCLVFSCPSLLARAKQGLHHTRVKPRKLAGKWSMNEDVFPMEHVDLLFAMVYRKGSTFCLFGWGGNVSWKSVAKMAKHISISGWVGNLLDS